MYKFYQMKSFGVKNLIEQCFTPGNLAVDQVRVRIRAISLNYRDLLMINGHYNPNLALPIIPISDGSGEIIEVGREVPHFKKGDRVCSTMIPDWQTGLPAGSIHRTTLGGPANGCLTECRDFFPKELMHIPAGIPYEEAATLPVAGLTAWNALQTIAHRKVASVLMLGTGGVSLSALGIAKSLGFSTVITSSSNEKLAQARALGANHTINYREQPHWGRVVKKIYSPGCDLVVEVGGQGTINQSIQALAPGGKIALIGVLSHSDQPVDLTRVLMSKIDIHGILVGSRNDFSDYLKFIDKKKVFPHIGHRFEGINEIIPALKLMGSGRHFGKITIRI